MLWTPQEGRIYENGLWRQVALTHYTSLDDWTADLRLNNSVKNMSQSGQTWRSWWPRPQPQKAQDRRSPIAWSPRSLLIFHMTPRTMASWTIWCVWPQASTVPWWSPDAVHCVPRARQRSARDAWLCLNWCRCTRGKGLRNTRYGTA